ncbi:hypothetical protein M405DRAFT_936206, partial [Rhizopogon salebrosus TDB-379]
MGLSLSRTETIDSGHVSSDGPIATDAILNEGRTRSLIPADDEDFLQDIDIQDVSKPVKVPRDVKSRDVGAFFSKPYAHKAKDGKTRNVRDCEPCKKRGRAHQIVSDTSTCRRHISYLHA